jgi:hypothetical protein
MESGERFALLKGRYQENLVLKKFSSTNWFVFINTLILGLTSGHWTDFSTIGYCVDLNHFIYPETYYNVTLNPITSSSGNYLKAAWLMDQYTDVNSTNDQKAGLQLAIWDTVFDDFTVRSQTDNDIEGWYDQYIKTTFDADDVMWSSLGYSYAISDAVRYSDGSKAQDLLIRLDPVPEPGTMLLLGLGMIGLGAVGRKRYAQE